MFGSHGYDRPRRGFRIPARLILALVIAGVSIAGYFLHTSTNPVTGVKQHISMTPQEEVALGLQAAPEMIRQMHGESRDAKATAAVRAVGAKIVASLPAEYTKYPFAYHLLADDQTVNAFALPGGQIFITQALIDRLETEGQLAGVLGHETGHVLARHSAEQMAKTDLMQGLVNATAVGTNSYNAQQMAGMVSQFLLLKYSRTDELQADRLGVRFMTLAGYDPEAMIGVMKVLEKASGGRGEQPDFMSTHPNPENRIGKIEEDIREEFPGGVPGGLKP